jgi:cytochrome P450
VTYVTSCKAVPGYASGMELPPGPKLPRFIQGTAFWNRPTAWTERCRQRYGNRFTVRLPGQPPFVHHSEPEQLKQIFTSPPEVLHPGEGARILEPVVGRHSVILLDEKPHLEQRKLMLPAFHGEKMNALRGLMEELTEREVSSWPSGEPVELHPRFQALTLDIILRSVFGMETGAELDALRGRMREILEFGTSMASLNPKLQRSFGGRGPYARMARARAAADEIVYEQIDGARRSGERGDDILSMLLDARHEDGAEMSREEIRDELMTALVAGHETTASALAFAFERLSQNPVALASLHDELDGGDGDEYLTATIYEALRTRPVLPNAEPRLVKQPVTIDGWDFEPGVVLIASAWLVHHNAEIYPEPFAFRPERFVGQSPGTYSWIPFGGGRRRCLGASFSMVEMKVVMREALSRFTIEPATELERIRRRGITISPRSGARLVLRERAAVPLRPAALASS